MAKKPEPWWREDRQAWFVQIDGKRHNLGRNKKAAWQRYFELMARPRKRTIVSTESLLAIIDAFLDWCQKHRAHHTYEWYRASLECFARKYPNLRLGDLKPYHVQRWIDGMEVSIGSDRAITRQPAPSRQSLATTRQNSVDSPISSPRVVRGLTVDASPRPVV